MFEDHNHAIQEILSNCGRVTPEQIEELREVHKSAGTSLADAVVDEGAITRQELLEEVAKYLNFKFLATPPTTISQDILRSIQPNVARMYGIVPIDVSVTGVTILTQDPFNSQVVDDLTFTLNRDVEIVVADPDVVASLLKASYGEEETTVDDILSGLDTDSFSTDEGMSAKDIENQANATPIIRYVNLVLTQAIKAKASDIHFEPFEDQFRIRYRVDGALYEMSPPPKSLAGPVISRVKVLSDMNIAEKRVPQDGRIKMTIAGRPVDLRVSTLPTVHGESVVLRVLDKSVVNLDLDMLNMPKDVLGNIREIASRPNGIFIVTGPTGSGKTTTLYSALREVNSIDVKILTAEDPIEYEIEGIMQVAINHTIGLTFARVLRSFLRQDPDIIMVGEIRDLETAQIAVQASLTGHLVLSTLHTNDAPGAVTRLVDMGLEPYLIAASLEAVLGQRLVRRICRSCRTPYEPTADLVGQLGLDPLEIADKRFYYGQGCTVCGSSGYQGRLGLYEMIMMTDTMRDLITHRAPTLVLKQKAIEQGMRTLREDGIRAIFDGASTIEEVLKYT